MKKIVSLLALLSTSAYAGTPRDVEIKSHKYVMYENDYGYDLVKKELKMTPERVEGIYPATNCQKVNDRIKLFRTQILNCAERDSAICDTVIKTIKNTLTQVQNPYPGSLQSDRVQEFDLVLDQQNLTSDEVRSSLSLNDGYINVVEVEGTFEEGNYEILPKEGSNIELLKSLDDFSDFFKVTVYENGRLQTNDRLSSCAFMNGEAQIKSESEVSFNSKQYVSKEKLNSLTDISNSIDVDSYANKELYLQAAMLGLNLGEYLRNNPDADTLLDEHSLNLEWIIKTFFDVNEKISHRENLKLFDIAKMFPVQNEEVNQTVSLIAGE